MTENKGRTAKFVYGICLSVLTAAVAAAFIVQVWAIYRSSASDPFTATIVAEKFSQIAVPVWLWIAAVVGGGVLSYVFPEPQEKPKTYTDVKKTLTRLKNRLSKDGDGWKELEKSSRTRTVVWIVCAALCVVAAVVSLVYLLDLDYAATFEKAFFISHVEAEKFIKIFPWILGAFAVVTGAVFYETYSVKKEAARAKELLVESVKKGEKPESSKEQSSVWEKLGRKLAVFGTDKGIFWTRIGLGAVGVVLVVVGIVNGGMADVFTKAINLCKQCIGLG